MTQVSKQDLDAPEREESRSSKRPIAVSLCRNALVLAMTGAESTARRFLAICREISDEAPDRPSGDKIR